MPRSLSNTLRQALYAQDTKEIPLGLLTVSGSVMPESLYLVYNTVPVVSRGHEFLPYFFDIELPDEREDHAPVGKLRIDAVDRTIIQALRTVEVPLDILFELVLASQPDFPELEIGPLKLREVKYTQSSAEGTLEGFRSLYVRYPAHIVTPTNAPGVFRGGPNI